MKKTLLILILFTGSTSVFGLKRPVLENFQWYIHILDGQYIPPGHTAKLYLNSAAGRAEGAAFCNYYLINYTLYPGNQIEMRPLPLRSKKFCSDPENAMELEYLFIAEIQTVNSYEVIDRRLYLYSDGVPVMELAPEPPSAPYITAYSYDESGNRILRETIYLVNDEPAEYSGTKGGSGYKKKAETAEKYQTGMKDEIEFKIYPNPTRGEIKVEINGGEKIAKAEVQIYDIGGQSVYRTKSVQNSYELNLSGCPDGVYLLRFLLNEKPYEWKIIKKQR